MSFIIDTHCHLNHDRLKTEGDVTQIVNAARAQNVAGMVTISCRIAQEYERLIEIAESHDNVWCTIGTHPHDADVPEEAALSVEDLVRYAGSHKKIIGIGESGLDYFYKNSSVEGQQESFRKHIRACMETKMPLIIHARDADEDIIRILKEEGAGQGSELSGVFHCFSSGRKMAEEGLELGFYISLSGMLTFKRSEELRDIAANVPLDRLLVETDSPYLAPEPHRGGINQPAYVMHTNTQLAKLFDLTSEEMAKITTRNFFNLFDKAQDTWVDPLTWELAS